MTKSEFVAYLIESESRYKELLDSHRRLEEALKDMNLAYVNLLENGRDRIMLLGGECDSVEKMESGCPYLNNSKQALATIPESVKESK